VVELLIRPERFGIVLSHIFRIERGRYGAPCSHSFGPDQYYGAFYPTAMLDLYMHIDRALERWARRKYKTLSGRLRAGVQWLRKMKDAEPQLFHHWRLVGNKVG
jgi:hypothetical protein